MAKNKKKTGIAQRSDIPLALRNQIARRQEIVAERDDAAKTALMLACVALNDLFGLGFDRLTRFAQRLNELIGDHYESPELLDYHRTDLQLRLEQMGFIFSPEGRMHSAYDPETGDFINGHKIGAEGVEFDPPGQSRRLEGKK